METWRLARARRQNDLAWHGMEESTLASRSLERNSQLTARLVAMKAFASHMARCGLLIRFCRSGPVQMKPSL